MSARTEIDAPTFRRVMGQFATGVTVIAAQEGEHWHAMTANSFTAVSLDPPLVLFCVARTARMATLIQRVDGFAVSILAGGQEEVSRQFAGSRSEETPARVALVDGPVAPLVAGAIASIDCRIEAIHEGGDHWIIVGRVVDLRESGQSTTPPLVFFRSRYCHVVQRELSQPAAPDRWSNEAIRIYHDEWSEDAGDFEREPLP